MVRGYLKPSVPIFQMTGKVPLTLKRYAEGYRDEYGKWFDGTIETVEIEANIQPLGYRDLIAMPESDRTKELVRVFSASEIRGTVEGVAKQLPDTFEWQGNTFTVIRVYKFSMGVLDHYKAIASRDRISA